jgi:hypothetical protein
LEPAYTEFFRPENKKQLKSLRSRVLDTSRSFLLMGHLTGFSFENTFRDWSRMIGELKASPIELHRKFGVQLETFLAPDIGTVEEMLGFKAEARSLVHHTYPETTINRNFLNLKIFLETSTNLTSEVERNWVFKGYQKQEVRMLPYEFTEMERVVTQYITTLYPGMDPNQVLKWVKNLDIQTKVAISRIVFEDHNDHHEIPVSSGTTRMTTTMNTSLAVVRDLNRHRGYGRYIGLPLLHGVGIDASTARQIFNQGFVLSPYLTDIPEFKTYLEEHIRDMYIYYEHLHNFISELEIRFGSSIDYSFLHCLLPLGHNVLFSLHGNPKQANYLPKLRRKEGGDIAYRDMAWKMHLLYIRSDPLLSGLAMTGKPNPADREEFYSRV